MLRQFAALILICCATVTHAEEPKVDPKDAGRDLRNVFLTTKPEKFGVQPSNDYPRVCAIAMDWPIDEHFATVVSVCDGSASVYTTGTFGIIGGVSHGNVRTAAKKLVKEANRYYDDSTPTQDFSYPTRGHVRFYLVTFGGVRVIETDLAAVTKRRGKYSTLFDLAQDLIGQLWIVIDERKK